MNSGTLHGTVYLQSGEDVIRNSHRIIGDVLTGAQDDRVGNSGLIDGLVNLGDGNELYRGGGG